MRETEADYNQQWNCQLPGRPDGLKKGAGTLPECSAPLVPEVPGLHGGDRWGAVPFVSLHGDRCQNVIPATSPAEPQRRRKVGVPL